jgi:acetyl esterase/lipase
MKIFMKNIILLIACCLVSACSSIIFATANSPALTFKGEIIKDIAYGELDRQKLDIYLPKRADQTPLPTIVFFHGGRWTFGNKDQYKFVGMTLADLGYAVVLPNTRLFPDVRFPSFVEDGAKAVTWVEQNMHNYNTNDYLFVSGHSSGAHVGALLLADEKYLAQHGLSANIIDGFAGLAGPYDFEPQTEELKAIFAPEEQFPDLVVSNYIDGDEAPMLLMYSKNDETVHIRNLNLLRDKINAESGKVSTIIYESGGHAGIVAALSWANPADLPVADDMDRFFRSITNTEHAEAKAFLSRP